MCYTVLPISAGPAGPPPDLHMFAPLPQGMAVYKVPVGSSGQHHHFGWISLGDIFGLPLHGGSSLATLEPEHGCSGATRPPPNAARAAHQDLLYCHACLPSHCPAYAICI